MSDGLNPAVPNPEAVRTALERLMQSPQFKAGARASRFIRFLVETALDGRADQLKEYVLGVEVFDRGSGFDSTTDTIVRVEAGKLRKRLEAYYRGPGRTDEVAIVVPKGTYIPDFRYKARRPPAMVRVEPYAAVPVAVSPFLNVTNHPEAVVWANGLVNELVSMLSCSARVRVVSQMRAVTPKRKALHTRDNGGSSGLRFVLEGSVRRHGDRVRVTVRLTEVATGLHVWSARFDRDVEDDWSVQEDLARAIIDGVHLALADRDNRPTRRRHTNNANVFEPYLNGCRLLARFDVRSQREALHLLEQASTADPQYPAPLPAIARALINLSDLGVMVPADALPRARAVLQRALSLDPGFAEAHSLLADVIARQDWNWQEAEKHHKLALRLDPDSPSVHDRYATSFLAPLGRIEEALAENSIARQLDPLSPHWERSYVFILMLGRRLRDVEHESARILQERTGDGFARLMLAVALHGQRRKPEALAQYERIFNDDPTVQHEGYVACLRAACGDRRPAEELLQRLRTLPPSEYIPSVTIAWLHLHLQQFEEALGALEQAILNREYELLLAQVGFGFDHIRNHPRLRSIIGKLGLS